MISFIEGKIEYLGDKFVILNAGGIGYRLYIPPKILTTLAKNQDKVKMFVHSQMNMREGTFDMYGFTDKGDLDMFYLLTSVSGIGPKNALGIMSSVEASHLKAAVVNEDAGYLKKVSGLGPKTAQRLILELQGKVEHLDGAGMDLGQEGQALDALLALGYTQYQAKEALKEVGDKTDSIQDRVREALKLLAKK
jgi:holliday junction DNA helicase RuvA